MPVDGGPLAQWANMNKHNETEGSDNDNSGIWGEPIRPSKSFVCKFIER